MNEKRRRLYLSARVMSELDAARQLLFRLYSKDMGRWLNDVMVTPSLDARVQPFIPTPDDVESIAEAAHWQRLNRMALEARSRKDRWHVAYAVVYDWLYREGSITPCLRGEIKKQWREILHVIKALPQWMLPEGLSAADHLKPHALINPTNNALITRPALSLADFIKQAWHVLEPNIHLSWNWHLDQMCAAGELVSKGLERHLAINVPPGSMKSLTFAVFWPAWEWTFNPSIQWLCATHSVPLARRDTEKCGKLISSKWYQQHYGDVLGGIKNNASEKIELTRGGRRGITSPGSGATGWRADRLLCDDLISVQNAFSPAKRSSANEWFFTEFSNRVNDSDRSSMTIIAQRVHEKDVFEGLARDPSYAWIVLSTRYKSGTFKGNSRDERRYLFEDERLVDGDLLHPDRFNEAADLKAQLTLGPVSYAAQHKQDPRTLGEGLVHYEWMEKFAYEELPRVPGRLVQVWDLRNGGDVLKESTSFAVGQLWFKPDNEERVFLIDQIRGKWSFLETEDVLLAQQEDPLWCRAEEVVIENKADGRPILETLRAKIPTLVAYDPGSRAKIQRWRAVLGYWKNGFVHLPVSTIPRVTPWIDDFMSEHYLGPGAPHNDQLDTSSMAIHYILSRPQDKTDPWDGWFD